MSENYMERFKSAVDSLFVDPYVAVDDDKIKKTENITDVAVVSVEHWHNGTEVFMDVALKESKESIISGDSKDWRGDPSVFTYFSISIKRDQEVPFHISIFESEDMSDKKKPTLAYFGRNDGSVRVVDVTNHNPDVKISDLPLVCETTFDEVVGVIASGNFEKLAKGNFIEKVGQK